MLPLIAILRGVDPESVVEVAGVLLEAGISQIEVPLNSPKPFESIGLLAEACGDRALIGAGTVLNVTEVERVAAVGGRLVVSPNADPAVIAATVDAGMKSCPGALTTTEVFAAIEAGADVVKLFPALLLGIQGLQAMRAVLPANVSLYAVGGIGAGDFSDWLAAGASGFGIGSSLYKPGMPVSEIAARAAQLVMALKQTGIRIDEPGAANGGPGRTKTERNADSMA